ncbi:sensor histidine kinase [Metabacillus malikii]|uniref:histidine kinase n=1 Tax=Metabacillus malikii TaxID=1504265 RepID=A0ABT9ZEV2_9BACI|nr:ATP-binding protein [Metabacillus malikii]MDQ0230361.1 two-component system sensor histidine kinase AtoS [Metabacillus malikii]
MKTIVRNMSLRLKIITVLLFITLVFGSFSLILVQTIEDVSRVSNTIERKNIPELLSIAQFSEELTVKEHIVKNSLNYNLCCSLIKDYQAYEDETNQNINEEVLPASLKNIKNDIDLLDFEIANNIQGLLEYNDYSGAMDYVESEYLPNLSKINEELEQLRETSLQKLNGQTNSFSKIIKASLWLLILLTLGAIFFSILVAYRMSASFTKPIVTMINKVDNIANGKYGLTVPLIDNQMELRQLTESINQMSKRLEESFKTILHDKIYREQILNSLSVGVITLNEDTDEVSLNSFAKKITGMNEQQVSNIVKTQGNGVNGEFWEMLFRNISFQNRKVAFVRNEEKKRLLVSKVELVGQYDEKIGCIVHFLDITETEELEQRIHQSEKLALVGEMAADAAHEIRNPLAVVQGFLALMNQSLSDASKQEYHIPLIMKEIERINFIIEEMLLTSKPGAPIRKEVYIQDILEEFLPLIVESTEDISFDIQLIRKKIKVDVKQIKQVFHNLFRNSIEAMGGVGNIGVTSEITGDYYNIYIMDSGPGITRPMVKTLFEPFSTSKENGTGLGLMIVKRIIENHKGTIELIESTKHGATFLIKLPVT